jgi:hypothetical protein
LDSNYYVDPPRSYTRRGFSAILKGLFRDQFDVLFRVVGEIRR